MFALSAAEWSAWADHYRRHGFPADRQEWATAIGSEYVGAVWGGKAKAADLTPRFGPRKPPALSAVMAWFDGFRPKPEEGSELNGG